MLDRKGIFMNPKKLYRLFTEKKLGVMRRKGRKPAHGRLHKPTTKNMKIRPEDSGYE